MGRRHCPLGGYSTPNDSSVKWVSAPGAYVHGDLPSALPSQVMRGRILALLGSPAMSAFPPIAGFRRRRRSGEVAPISALRGTAIEPQGSTLNRPHGLASTSQVAVPAAAGRCARILNFIKALCGARSIGIH